MDRYGRASSPRAGTSKIVLLLLQRQRLEIARPQCESGISCSRQADQFGSSSPESDAPGGSGANGARRQDCEEPGAGDQSVSALQSCSRLADGGAADAFPERPNRCAVPESLHVPVGSEWTGRPRRRRLSRSGSRAACEMAVVSSYQVGAAACCSDSAVGRDREARRPGRLRLRLLAHPTATRWSRAPGPNRSQVGARAAAQWIASPPQPCAPRRHAGGMLRAWSPGERGAPGIAVDHYGRAAGRARSMQRAFAAALPGLAFPASSAPGSSYPERALRTRSPFAGGSRPAACQSADSLSRSSSRAKDRASSRRVSRLARRDRRRSRAGARGHATRALRRRARPHLTERDHAARRLAVRRWRTARAAGSRRAAAHATRCSSSGAASAPGRPAGAAIAAAAGQRGDRTSRRWRAAQLLGIGAVRDRSPAPPPARSPPEGRARDPSRPARHGGPCGAAPPRAAGRRRSSATGTLARSRRRRRAPARVGEQQHLFLFPPNPSRAGGGTDAS